MADYQKFKWGNVTFPLAAATTNTLLQDADPALYHALAYWKAVLIYHLGSRLVAEATLVNLPITTAVADTIHFDPGPFLLDHAEVRFPLLAAYRVSSNTNDRTVTWEHTEAEWDVAYVLPTRHWGGMRRVQPIFHAVELVLTNRTTQGFDPSYLSGAKVWGTSYAGIERIGFIRSSYGRYEDAQGITYDSLVMRALVKEIVRPATGDLGTIDGMSVNEQIVDGTTLDSAVLANTDDLPPEPG